MDSGIAEQDIVLPASKEELTDTERLLVWAVRVWVAHHKAGAVPCRGYSYAFIRVGLPDAPLLLHRLMQMVAAHARRGIDVRCIGCRQVSPDEGLVLAALAAGFGRVVTEVGAAIMVGGNIRGYTRTLTTAIVLETGKGDFAQGMALGIILLIAALGVNLLSHRMQALWK